MKMRRWDDSLDSPSDRKGICIRETRRRFRLRELINFGSFEYVRSRNIRSYNPFPCHEWYRIEADGCLLAGWTVNSSGDSVGGSQY